MDDSPTFLDALTRRPAGDSCAHAHPPEVVRLWDGRDHCVQCVEAACPGLAAFARGREALEDSIAFDRAGGMLTWWKFGGLFFGVLALVGVGLCFGVVALVGVGSAAVLDRGSAVLLIGTMALALTVGMLGALPSVFKARHVLPTVRVRDGLVEVYRPNHGQGRSPVTTFRLEGAYWRPGKLQEDSSCRGRGGAIVADQRVVILRSPRRWPGTTPPSEFTAVGSSPELVRIWQGFLELAGVPKGGSRP